MTIGTTAIGPIIIRDKNDKIKKPAKKPSVHQTILNKAEPTVLAAFVVDRSGGGALGFGLCGVAVVRALPSGCVSFMSVSCQRSVSRYTECGE